MRLHVAMMATCSLGLGSSSLIQQFFTIFSLVYQLTLPFPAPTGIPRFHDLSEVAGNAQRVCLTTHAAPVCVAACVALAALVAQLLQGAAQNSDELERALGRAAELAAPFVEGEEERKALQESLLDTESR